jgi:hypothetical protein
MKPFAPPIAVDLLTDAIERVRTDLNRARSRPERARTLWAGVLASRNLGAQDVIEREFWGLAFSTGLIWNQASRSRSRVLPHSFETVSHLIRWGLLARDPFGRPPA